ncbi:MAG: helix-turn-helix transcriptional regulator [Acidobacteria bacterium]|nr:helix-turn-helix transcriptional regulator [Acidobacteriota bacterium]MBI3489323.1 helix-turn-helix transcriptional regulator [Acidobacteriota bacterium]
MKSYGQFCSIARALELLGERWTLLVVRELLCGSRRFGEFQRGIPRISRTMLSARLRELLDGGVIVREEEARGPSYRLTAAGMELAGTIRELGTWGQRWLPRSLPRGELDLEALLWDMQRRVRPEALPSEPVLVRIEVSGAGRREARRYLLLRRSEVSLCSDNPGFPEALHVRAPLQVLTGWWRGDLSIAEARSAGLLIEGRRPWARAFPGWFGRYLFAEIPPVQP